jgi:anti-anti-sigma regulatory factor
MSHIWQPAGPSNHWHLIGQRWRPLHDQLTGLQDVATWMSVSAHAASSRPEAIGPVSVSPSLGIASARHGDDYGLFVVCGELRRPDMQRVRGQLHGMLTSGVRHLVVDLSGVDMVDPRLGPALDLMYRRLHALSGTLTLVGVPTGLVPTLASGPERIRESVCAEGAEASPGRSSQPSGVRGATGRM